LLFTDWNIYPENISVYLKFGLYDSKRKKKLAIPHFKIPLMNFKKEILVTFRKILVPFRTTKDCPLVDHFYWFGRFVPQLGF
jgi:hypothetical protein